jgi:threonine/homoserine/homoserine lactone efflux protein
MPIPGKAKVPLMPLDAATLSSHQMAAFTLGYVLVLFTPGPNFIVLAGVALMRGFRGSIPICFGVALGSVLLAALAALAADTLPAGGPWDAIGRGLGGLLLLYIAWRLLSAGPPSPTAAPVRGDFALGFGTALFNPITGAYFAGQFLTMRGESGLDHDTLILALVGAIALLRSFIIIAVCASLAFHAGSLRMGARLTHAAGALFGVAAIWLLASAASGPDGVMAVLGSWRQLLSAESASLPYRS